MYDVGRSGIKGDTSKSYNCNVEKLSNIYGILLGLGDAYLHKFVKKYLDLVPWLATTATSTQRYLPWC